MSETRKVNEVVERAFIGTLQNYTPMSQEDYYECFTADPLPDPVQAMVTRAFGMRIRLAKRVSECSGVYDVTKNTTAKKTAEEREQQGKMKVEWEGMQDAAEEPRHPESGRPLLKDETEWARYSLPISLTWYDTWYDKIKGQDKFNSPTHRYGKDHLYGAEAAARRCGEATEKMFISSVRNARGKSTIFHEEPVRPGPGCTLMDFTADPLKLVRQMVDDARKRQFYGPFGLFNGPAWDMCLDTAFVPGEIKDPSGWLSLKTKRQTIVDWDYVLDKPGPERTDEMVVMFCQRLDFLGFTKGTHDTDLILLQLTPEVIRTVNALNVKCIPWKPAEWKEGKEQYRVCSSILPLMRTDYFGRAGVVVAEMLPPAELPQSLVADECDTPTIVTERTI